MPIDPTGNGPKVPKPGSKGPGEARIPGASETKGRHFSDAVQDASTMQGTTCQDQVGGSPGSAKVEGIRRLAEIAQALKSGRISSKEEAVRMAVRSMMEDRLAGVPPDKLKAAAMEVGRLVQENEVLAARIASLLDRLTE